MIRSVSADDYPVLCEWWGAQSFPSPPKEILPATGYMANEVAAGFLYLTNSPIAWLEWVVADPKAEKKLRNQSINEVIEHISKSAKVTGNMLLFTSTNVFPFCERLRRLGFNEGDKKTYHFIKTLGE